MSISFKHPSNCFHFRKLWLLSYLGTNNQVCFQNQILKKGIFDNLIFMQMENSKNYIFSLLDNNHPLTWILKTLKRGCNIYVWYSNVWFTVCFASRFPEKVQSGVPIASGGVKIRDFPTILSTLTLNSDQKKNNLHICYSSSVYWL